MEHDSHLLNALRRPVTAASRPASEDPDFSEVEDDSPDLFNVLNRMTSILEPSRARKPILEARRGL